MFIKCAVLTRVIIVGILETINKLWFYTLSSFTQFFSPLLCLENTPQKFLFLQLSGTLYSDFVLHSHYFVISFLEIDQNDQNDQNLASWA